MFESSYLYWFTTLIVICLTYFIRLAVNLHSLKTKLSKPIKSYAEPDLQNRFSKAKIPKNIDYIIVGSGTSGLTSAAALSKLGKKVLVLE